MAKIKRDAGESLDDEAALLSIARQILGGPTETGRASYQIGLTVCDQCGRGWQHGNGEPVEVDASVVEMAECDGQRIGHVNATQVGHNGDATHVGTDPEKPEPAHQEIPPRIRREVMHRDGGCCVVPGCRNATYVDVHHLNLRSAGGRHHPDELVVLCAAHHRASHRGALQITGRVSTGLTSITPTAHPTAKSRRPSSPTPRRKRFAHCAPWVSRETNSRRASGHSRRGPRGEH